MSSDQQQKQSKQQEPVKENPKELCKQQPSNGTFKLSAKEAKSIGSVSSFEDFSKYRQGKAAASAESAKMDPEMAKVLKEREEIIKQLVAQQEAETARRLAEGNNKSGGESSESIYTTCQRYRRQMQPVTISIENSQDQDKSLQGDKNN